MILQSPHSLNNFFSGNVSPYLHQVDRTQSCQFARLLLQQSVEILCVSLFLLWFALSDSVPKHKDTK